MPRNKLSFRDKVAIVTGSTRGIGKSIADLLVNLGCNVIYTGTGKRSGIEKGGYLQLDLSNDDSLHGFVEDMKKLRRLDILINNAGINVIQAIDEITDDSWNRILKINLSGAMVLMREASKIMKKSGNGGKILNVSSIFGIVSRVKRDSYSASKAGMIGLTRAAALDLAADRILVNALCPGFTLTDLTRSVLSKNEMAALIQEVPMKRMAEESEIAQAAVFLCSDLNTYMTGQVMVADGGYIIR